MNWLTSSAPNNDTIQMVIALTAAHVFTLLQDKKQIKIPIS